MSYPLRLRTYLWAGDPGVAKRVSAGEPKNVAAARVGSGARPCRKRSVFRQARERLLQAARAAVLALGSNGLEASNRSGCSRPRWNASLRGSAVNTTGANPSGSIKRDFPADARGARMSDQRSRREAPSHSWDRPGSRLGPIHGAAEAPFPLRSATRNARRRMLKIYSLRARRGRASAAPTIGVATASGVISQLWTS